MVHMIAIGLNSVIKDSETKEFIYTSLKLIIIVESSSTAAHKNAS